MSISKLFKTLLLTGVLSNSLLVQAQNNAVARAEKAFAKLAVDSSIKKAFVTFLDSNSVVFQNGEAQNGLAVWTKAKESTGKLLWQPVYTGLSKDGSMGFSTGPFEYRASMEDSVRGSGQYTSVWVKNSAGNWKVLVDMGVLYAPTLYGQQKGKQAPELTPDANNKITWQALEAAFTERYKKEGAAAIISFSDAATWLNTAGAAPATTLPAIAENIKRFPTTLSFVPIAGGMSATADMAYAYGQVLYNGKKENYLHVWGHRQNGWKLLIQVLSW